MGGVGCGSRTRFRTRSLGLSGSSLLADSFLLVDSTLEVLPDITVFIRGDTNGDTIVDLSDAQRTLGFLFLGWDRIRCLDAADSDDDGRVNVSDAIYKLSYLFLGGPVLPPPYPGRGSDPTEDGLECVGRPGE